PGRAPRRSARGAAHAAPRRRGGRPLPRTARDEERSRGGSWTLRRAARRHAREMTAAALLEGSAASLADAVRRRQTSAEEIAVAALERCREASRKHSSFLTIADDRALAD